MKVKHLNYFLLLLVQFIIVDSCGNDSDSTSRARKIAEVSDKYNIVFYQDYGDSKLGRYSESDIIAENNAVEYINGAGSHKPDDYNLSIISVNGDKAMKGTMDKGEYGLTGAVNPTDNGGGFRYWTELEQGHTELYMSYNIMFRPGMDFVLHGKLPAMNGGKWNDNDGTPITGVSGQIAFVGDKNGDLEGAIYWYSRWATHQKSGGNGYWKNPDGSPFQFDVSDSTWYNITIRISLNTLGQANGFMEGFINGKLASQWKNLELRTVECYLDILSAYWFFGGADPQFAPNYDEWVLIDDMCAFTYADGVDVERGQTPSAEGRVLDLPFMKTNSSRVVDKEPPSLPTQLKTLQADQNSLKIGWNASIDNMGVDGYNVYLNNAFIGSTSETSFTLSNLNSDTNYEISVSAFDKAANESARSEVLNAFTAKEDQEPPSQPSGLRTLSVTENSIQLAWSRSTDDIEVTGYWLYVNELKRGPAHTEQYTLTGLVPGFEYRISVTSFDAKQNESLKSQEIIVYTLNPEASTVPALPEVEILELQKESNPGSTSVLKSLGFAEIEDYGIIYSETEDSKGMRIPIYADQFCSSIRNNNRVQNNLQVFYNFSNESENIITDKSGIEQPVDLYINQPLNTIMLSGQGIRIIDSLVICSEGDLKRLMTSFSRAQGITFEAWIKPNFARHSDPATILAISDENNDFAFSIEQIGDEDSFDYAVKMNTSYSDKNDVTDFKTTSGFSSNLLQHLVYTWDRSSKEVIYVNGKEVQSGTRFGEISGWSGDYQLTLANDLHQGRSWNGTFYLVALYDKALDEQEVKKNYNAGFGEIVYETDLSFLQTNTQYSISPFVRTDQGVFYGKKKSFLIKNILDYTNNEQHMAVVPNPSDGQFMLNYEDHTNIESNALLRIADSSGKVVFTDRIHLGENLNRFQRSYDLSSLLKSGIYNVMLILGSKSKTERLILY